MPPTLFLIHGLGDDSSAWNALLKQPELSDVSTTFVTIPGFGGTSWSGEHVEDVAEQLRKDISEVDGDVVVVGHSLGGVIGTVIAEDRPTNLVGLVSIEGNLTEADCVMSASAWTTPRFDRWFDLFSGPGRAEVRYTSALSGARGDAFLSFSGDLVRLTRQSQIGQRFADLSLPKVVIFGSRGYSPETVRFIRQTDLPAVEIANARHWVQDDKPQETAVALTDWMRTLEPLTRDPKSGRTAPANDRSASPNR